MAKAKQSASTSIAETFTDALLEDVRLKGQLFTYAHETGATVNILIVVTKRNQELLEEILAGITEIKERMGLEDV